MPSGCLTGKIEDATLLTIAQSFFKNFDSIVINCQPRCWHIKNYRCVKRFHVTQFSSSTLFFVSATVATPSESFLCFSQFLSPTLLLFGLSQRLCIYPFSRQQSLSILYTFRRASTSEEQESKRK